MTSYSIQNARWHGRACAALSLISVLLLAASAPGAAAAQGRMVVDNRTIAQAEADEQKRELEEMRHVNVDARRNARQLQRQIDALQAEVIDRGLLLTLDDALFAGNSARLRAGGSERLDKLVDFLNDYPHRNAQIESSTACKASAGYDATLSQKRAAVVADYLIQRGMASARLSARSSKQSSSVNEDCDAHSLHRNRQVIVIIEDALTSAIP
jgi:outer membrane protein OmpA-like peptidoglycan-associated protein